MYEGQMWEVSDITFARLRNFTKTLKRPRGRRSTIVPESTRKIAVCTIQTIRQHGGPMSMRYWLMSPSLSLRTAVRNREEE